jgi:signal peptidase I
LSSNVSHNRHIIRDMQEELFSKRGEGWFRVVSGSMRPLIEVGDRIFVKRTVPAEIKPRDVILFKSEGAFVTHRVLKISEVDGKQMIVQKGDAGGIPATIPGDAVIGRVAAN